MIRESSNIIIKFSKIKIDYATDSTDAPINVIDNKRKNSDKSSKFKALKNSENNKNDKKKASKTDKSLVFLDQTNICDASLNEKSTFVNNKNNTYNLNTSLYNNNLNLNSDIINCNNNTNCNKLIKNNEKELINSEKKEFELKLINEISEAKIQAEIVYKTVNSGQFVQIDDTSNNNNIKKQESKSANEFFVDDNEKEEENINKIKNQIRTNLTFFNMIQQNKGKKGTFDKEEDFLITDINYNNNIKHFNYIDEIISEKNEYDGIKFKLTEEEKLTKIIIKQESNEIKEKLSAADDIDKELKTLETKKKKNFERKKTDNIASSFNLRAKVLPNLHISNMISKDKTSSKQHIKMKKLNLLSFNTNKFANNYSSSNSKLNSASMSGNDEAFSLKSFKFAKQRTIKQNHLKPDKFGYYNQNSHFSYKSGSSYKHLNYTFQNQAQFRDRESQEIGNSLLGVSNQKNLFFIVFCFFL
jgi:hypothetical protein